MPIYEYTCDKCGRPAELLVRSSEEPTCPHCGSRQLSRLLSVVTAHAKSGGSGGDRAEPASGPCGASCGCFPQG